MCPVSGWRHQEVQLLPIPSHCSCLHEQWIWQRLVWRTWQLQLWNYSSSSTTSRTCLILSNNQILSLMQPDPTWVWLRKTSSRTNTLTFQVSPVLALQAANAGVIATGQVKLRQYELNELNELNGIRSDFVCQQELVPFRLLPFRLLPFRLLPFRLLITTQCHS